MDYFTCDETGDQMPNTTRTRGQKMGIAAMIIQARREARAYRIEIACYIFGIAFCVTGIIAIVSLCAGVALGR